MEPPTRQSTDEVDLLVQGRGLGPRASEGPHGSGSGTGGSGTGGSGSGSGSGAALGEAGQQREESLSGVE